MQYDELEPNQTPHERVSPDLTVMQPGEQTISVIKRHPIGILLIYLMSIIVLVIIALFVFWFLPSLSSSSTVNTFGKVALIIVIILSIVSTFIYTIVYWGNLWIVTTDSVTQVTQTSLFNRSSSQLSLVDLEDVTAEQRGLLQRLVNYGQLRLETAGEREKYILNFCPNPDYYAREILAARETFVEKPSSQDSE